jgi:hypothetical protein
MKRKAKGKKKKAAFVFPLVFATMAPISFGLAQLACAVKAVNALFCLQTDGKKPWKLAAHCRTNAMPLHDQRQWRIECIRALIERLPVTMNCVPVVGIDHG